MIRLVKGRQCKGSTEQLETCKKIQAYLKNTKNDRCKAHSTHNPRNHLEARKVYIQENCIICSGIHYGVQPACSYDGESVASTKEKTATTIIPLLNLVQFGLVRHRLHYTHYYARGPTWKVDMNSKTVFLNVALSDSIARLFETWGCKIISQINEDIFTLSN